MFWPRIADTTFKFQLIEALQTLTCIYLIVLQIKTSISLHLILVLKSFTLFESYGER